MKVKKWGITMIMVGILSCSMILGQGSVLKRKSAILNFAEEVIGKITVLSGDSELVADINKRDHRLLKIALKPGEYTINLVNEGFFRFCQIDLTADESKVIMLSDFKEPEVVRQEEKDVEDGDEKIVEIEVKDVEFKDYPKDHRDRPRRRYQRNTLLKDSHVNFFIESSLKSIKINGEREYFAGMNIGVTLGDKVVLGFRGYGNITMGMHPADFMEKETILGYGGFLIGYNFHPNSIVNTRVSALIGAGCRGLVEEGWRYSKYDHDYGCDRDWWDWDNYMIGEEQVFFFIEPQITLYINMTRNFKFNFNLSYRYTDDEVIDAKKLTMGFGLNITI